MSKIEEMVQEQSLKDARLTGIAMGKLPGKTVLSVDQTYEDEVEIRFTDGTLAIIYIGLKGSLGIDAGE